ncbi:hypothetical protein NE556_08415 [[Clostridium] symbiosum]|uniref:glycine-rich domain-containing protein n=1 Tax=Clostridium symbiosum TaxID=1512 RepID=UPI00210A7094|nr:hypothetical protein [[Clostridium] symbiosum]MCQ4835234.1 hypothetical protein [[Clostridium] symbiosum]
MSESILVKSGGGADLDVVTAIAADIVAPKVSVDKDGEPIIGTIIDRGNWNSSDLVAGASVTIPAGKHGGSGKVTAKSLASQTACTATDGYVYSGKTYWKDGALRTGGMAVNSILSFSAAAYGGKQILLKWQNPYAATGKPFSGVEIRYGTGGYPGTAGSVIYTGAGNNTAPGGWSQIIVTLPALGTTYYFSLRSYATCSAGTMYSGVTNAYAATQQELWLTFTQNSTYTIPIGYSKMDAFAVGGGGGASSANADYEGNGGGGGYTSVVYGIGVSPGESLSIGIGAGNIYSSSVITGTSRGGASFVSRASGKVLEALGGYHGDSDSSAKAADGGSGGGAGIDQSGRGKISGNGGSNGGNGGTTSGGSSGGNNGHGQGTTTRAWGNGTLYAGGGGGGNRYGPYNGYSPGTGGAGGGGNGAMGGGAGANGVANTGGGAGGGSLKGGGGTGGSGIVLLHIY